MKSLGVPHFRQSPGWLSVGLAVLGLAIIGAMWLFVLSSLQADRQRAVDNALTQAAGLTHAFEEHTQRAFQQIDQITQFVAYNVARDGPKADLSGLVRQGLISRPGLLSVSVVDAKGNLEASTQSGLAFNISDREHFTIHRDGLYRGLFISQPLADPSSKNWMVFMTRRLQTAAGQFTGVVVVAADPAYFTSFYSETQFGTKGLVSLVGLDWVVRARRSGDRHWYGQTAGNNYLINQIKKGNSGTYKAGSQLDGVNRFLAFKVLKEYRMVVFTGLAEEEVLAPHLDRRTKLLDMTALMTALLVLVFAGLVALARRLVQSRARFEAASDAQLDAFCILGAVRDQHGQVVDFRVLHCNERAAVMARVPRSRLLGNTLHKVLGDNSDTRFFDMYHRVVTSRQPLEEEWDTQAPGGPRVWLHHQVVPVGDGVALTTRDVTAERRREQTVRSAQLALQKSEQRLRDIADSVPGLVSYIDRDERFTFVNRYYQTLQGLMPEDLLGKALRDIRGERVYATLQSHVQAALRGERVHFEWNGDDRGSPCHFQYHYIPDVGEDGSVPGFFAVGFDVTSLKEAELRQQRSEQRLRTITDNLPVLISYIDRDERTEFANKTCLDWLGLDPAVVLGKTMRELWAPELYALRQPFVRRALSGERLEFEAERVALGATRTLHTTYIPEFGKDGQVRGIFMLSTDVSAQKAVEQQLMALARIDTLTGLANRHDLNERLPLALARAQRSGEALVLMFLDIDRFKAINDTFGHAVGDEVLKEFANRLRQCVRVTDTVVRLAGDEFLIILEAMSGVDEPQIVARKILAQVCHPFPVAGQPLIVTTSIGMACCQAGGVSADELMARADKALYAAKATGRNTFHLAPS